MRPGDAFLRKKQKAVYDDRLICVEIYNPNNFDILVERDKRFDRMVVSAKIPLGPERAICKADDFLFLPHQFVIYTAMNGAPFLDIVTNKGDLIGKGNKFPSAPIFEQR